MTNMKKWWTTRLSGQSSDKHAVKLSQLKLELGLLGARVTAANDKVAIEITGITSMKGKGKGKPPSSSSTPLSLVPFQRTSKRRCTHTTSCRRFLSAKTPSLVWDARDLSGFNLVLKHGSLGACDMAFHVLYGEGAVGESKAKMTVVGKVPMTLDMAALLAREGMKTESSSHHHLQRRLPIRLKVNGLIIEATLLVYLRLLKLRGSDDDSPKPFENWVQSDEKRGIIGKVKYLTSLAKKNDGKFDQAERPYESDGSPVFDSDDSSNDSSTSSGSGSGSSMSGAMYNSESRLTFSSSDSRTRLDTLQRNWSQLPQNRSFKGWNFKTNIRKQETLTTCQGPFTKSDELSPQLYLQGNASGWEIKEISSRDAQAKLKTKVFFASFDQRSEKASGESACTVLVALIAHWLHSNEGMPTKAQFNSLITQGSSEWRKLCNSDYYSKLFPDKHFDLETIIEANLRPLIVLPHKSYTGFFSPGKFQCLKGAMSFDEIWDEINSKVVDYEPRIYIVSWNDHFFALKVERDAYYIIDSLGERLYEGCQRAFILKFDDSCVMYGKVDEVEEAPSKGNSGAKTTAKGEERLETVCRGKECCKEFIKRFLAAIPLRQLEKEEKKWAVSSPHLYRQLQIDFHFSSSSSSSASAPSSMLSFLTSGHLEA